MSGKEKISLTRALKEVKDIDQRIENQINSLSLVDFKLNKYGDKALRSGLTEAEFTKNAKSGYDSVTGLLARKQKLREAIAKANNETKVKVGEKEYSITGVLQAKASLELRNKLLTRLNAFRTVMVKEQETNKAQLDVNVNNLLQSTYGKDRKPTGEEHDLIAKPYIHQNELHVIDPLNVTEKAIALEAEITKFLQDVDIALSEVNALTIIEI